MVVGGAQGAGLRAGVGLDEYYRIDQGENRALYAALGVGEYWQCEPTGSYLRPPVLGFRLVAGCYVPVPVARAASGLLSAPSAVLGLEVRLRPGAPVREALRFYDPVHGQPLRSYREASGPGRTGGPAGPGSQTPGGAAARALSRRGGRLDRREAPLLRL